MRDLRFFPPLLSGRTRLDPKVEAIRNTVPFSTVGLCASLELGTKSQADMVATRADSSSTLRGSAFLVQGLGGFLRGPRWGFQGRPRKRSVPRASRRAKKYALRSTVGRSTCAGLSPPSQDESSGTRGALVALRFPTFWALRAARFFFFARFHCHHPESGGSPGGRGGHSSS